VREGGKKRSGGCHVIVSIRTGKSDFPRKGKRGVSKEGIKKKGSH